METKQIGIMTKERTVLIMKLRKLITMGIAAVMAVSAMSVSAFAKETNSDDTWEKRWEEAEYGTVDSLEELIENKIEPFGLPSSPSIAGSAYTYLYDNSGNTSYDSKNKLYTNKDASFNFEFSSNCTTKTKQYAEFLIMASSTSKKIYFEGSGGVDTSVNITMEPISSSLSDIGPKVLPIHSSNYDSVYFKGFKPNYTYAIKITPKTAGKAISGTIKVSGTDF